MNIAAPSMQNLSVPEAEARALEQALAQSRAGQLGLAELLGLAGTLQQRGHLDAALLLYETWVAHQQTPLRVVALYNMGTLLSQQRLYDRAEQVYRQALEIKPDFTQAALNLGHQLEHLGRPAEALQCWAAVADGQGPQDPMGTDPLELRIHALNNSARLLEQLRQYPAAEARMRQSLALKPAQPDVTQHYVHIRQKQCAWPVYQPLGEVTMNQLIAGTSLLAMLSASDDPALQMMASQRFVHDRVQKYSGAPLHKLAAQQRPREGKIRIGYLSGDLCMHAVGLLTAELYELHDKSRFELHAFCWSREDGSPLRARIVAAMDKVWRIGELDDRKAAELIAGQGIDVLVDLQGLTSGARPNILAYRPSPVQVGYLGLPATSMLPGVDWIVADRFVMPPEYLPYCSEKPIYLPHCYQVSDRRREAGPLPTRAQYGLPEQGFVYCSFNNNHKLGEETFSAWMRILTAVPDSVLWLLADNEWSRAHMQQAAIAQGVDPARLVFAPREDPPAYLARFQLPDLVLDTFPYNAGTTASDCLWMGTPILTRSGRTYISRMCGSLLTAVGLPDLVTHSLDEYERLAITIGRNPARAASYKRYLREHGRQSALFDLPQIVKDLESEFERLALAQRG